MKIIIIMGLECKRNRGHDKQDGEGKWRGYWEIKIKVCSLYVHVDSIKNPTK
jgi:hypothetical protein